MGIKKIIKRTGGVFGLNEVREDLTSLRATEQALLQEVSELKSEVNYLTELVKVLHPIDQVSSPYGPIRTLQQGNAKLLEFVLKLCKEHHLESFLDFGTLLGAVRHKGFIPWDDDIDVSMPRCDYDKLAEIIEKQGSRDSVFAVRSDIMRVFYKNTPLQIDIFPVDFYHQRLSEAERIELAKQMRQFNRDTFHYDWEAQQEPKMHESYEEAQQCRRDFLGPEVSHADGLKNHYTLLRGVEFPYSTTEVYATDSDWYYPLKKAEFCGMEVNIPNQPETCLSLMYGDYWAYPRDIQPHHPDIDERITPETMVTVERIISGKEKLDF